MFIDYWEATQKDIKDAARMMREEKPYIYGRVVLPWDGRGAANYLEEIGFHNVVISERTPSVQASIEEVRRQFSRFYFDTVKCKVGIDHLRQYKRKWDEENRVFGKVPLHDDHSHGADALRTGVEGEFDPLYGHTNWSEPIKVETEFDPRIQVRR